MNAVSRWIDGWMAGSMDGWRPCGLEDRGLGGKGAAARWKAATCVLCFRFVARRLMFLSSPPVEMYYVLLYDKKTLVLEYVATVLVRRNLRSNI